MYSLVTPAAIPNMQVCPTGLHDTIVEEDGKHQLEVRAGHHSLAVAASVGLAVQVMGHAGSIWMTITPGHGPTPGGGTEVGGYLTP